MKRDELFRKRKAWYNSFMIKALEEKNDGRFDYSGPDQGMTWTR